MDRAGSRGNTSSRRFTLTWDLKNYLHSFSLMLFFFFKFGCIHLKAHRKQINN